MTGWKRSTSSTERRALKCWRSRATSLAAQEPGDAEQIDEFCKVNFGLSFPLMAKVEVNGDGAPPLYDWLKSEAPGLMGTKSIKWNFTKFLIGRDGKVVRRYAPNDKPESIAKDIEKLL
jgi:glutathione peroxidase